MRKIYAKPETTVIVCNVQPLLKGSLNVGQEYKGSEVLSRKGGDGSSWDDDE